MSKYIIAFGSLLFLFSSCQRENNIGPIEIEEDIPSPEEVWTTKLEGRITDTKFSGIPETLVDIYQNGELITTVVTDENGSYVIDDIFYSDLPYRIYAHKEGYHPKMADIETDQEIIDNVNISLLSDDIEINGNPVSPLDSNLVLIQGSCINNNVGVPGIFVIGFSESNEFADYAISDSQGNYSFYAQPNSTVLLFYFTPCPNVTAQDFLNLEILEENTVLDPIEIEELSISNLQFKGTVEHCSNVIISGELVVYLDNPSRDYVGSIQVVNGVFDTSIEVCMTGPSYYLEYYDHLFPFISPTTVVSENELDNIEITFCGGNVTNDLLEIYIGNELLSFEDNTATIDSLGNLIINANNVITMGSLDIIIKNPELLENEITYFELSSTNYLISNDNHELEFLLQKITDDVIIGAILGNVVNSINNESDNIAVFFQLELE